MSFPGNGSTKPSKVPAGFRSESQKGTTTESGRTGHRDGMGRDGMGRKQLAEQRSSKLMARAVKWCREKLPDQSRNRAVAAFIVERGRLGRDPSPAEVLARLKALGQDRESWIAKHGRVVLDAENAWLEARGL